jgi:pyruvate/2-oxoglutarate/acetoin dehydrogenase E1 component
VIDLRTIKPLNDIDWPLIKQCLHHTGRLMLVDEDRMDGGYSQILAGKIASQPELFEKLDAPISVVGSRDCFIPYGAENEKLIALQVSTIIEKAKELKNY